MILAVDIRNDLVTMGLREGETWILVKKFGAFLSRTSDEYAMFMSAAADELMQFDGIDLKTAWISSVVPLLTPVIAEAVTNAFGICSRLIEPGIRTGLKIRTDLPSELGTDLVCAAVAAREICKEACVVIDSGAALTFSAINAMGEFEGAVIAPGMSSSLRSLRESTAQLPLVKLENPGHVIGRTTVQSIQSGILFGYEGMVGRILERMQAELEPGGEHVEVIGTGDELGRKVLAACGHIHFVPELALDGIAIIAGRNSA
jgi:type III pantothenate kinase